jgi:hypothetical protein
MQAYRQPYNLMVFFCVTKLVLSFKPPSIFSEETPHGTPKVETFDVEGIYLFEIDIVQLAMCPDAPYVIILLCLMPDDFTCQGRVLPLNGFHLILNLSNFITTRSLSNNQEAIIVGYMLQNMFNTCWRYCTLSMMYVAEFKAMAKMNMVMLCKQIHTLVD